MTHVSADYSAMNDFWDCHRYYRNRYILNLVPMEQDIQVPLLFGEAMHQARHVLATGATVEQAIARFDEVYTVVCEARDIEDNARSPFVGHSLLWAYHKKWSTPDDLLTELGFSLELPEANASLIGRIDYIANDYAHTVTDVKTSKGTFWLPQARLNFQLIGYAHALRELKGIEATQVCIDALIAKSPPKKILAAEMPEHEYALKLFDDLHRRYGSIQPRDYDLWAQWFIDTTGKIRACLENDWWPCRAPKACNRFGSKSCEYDLLCKAADEEQEKEFMQKFFKEEPWHPYE